MEPISRSNVDQFFAERNWSAVGTFWSQLMRSSSVPDFISGTPATEYGLTDLRSIHDIGIKEFTSNDPRFKRRTFAARIGYDGSKYHGYQMQKGAQNVTF